MKKTTILFMLLLAFTGCKELSYPSTQSVAKEETIIGEFLYWNNAAVFKTDSEIYGVVADEKMHELNNRCKPLKKDEYDMIRVTVKGNIIKNPKPDSWAEIIQVKEVISVSKIQEKEKSGIIIKNK